MYSEPAESVNYDEHLGVRRVSENKQQHAKLVNYLNTNFTSVDLRWYWPISILKQNYPNQYNIDQFFIHYKISLDRRKIICGLIMYVIFMPQILYAVFVSNTFM